MTTVETFNIRPFLFLAVLTLLAAFVLLLEVPLEGVINNPAHSVRQHGDDAVAIHNALDCAGPSSVWQSRSWRSQNKFFQTCQLDDGRWGCRIVQVGKDALRELTSFVVKDGTWLETKEYLTARSKCIWPER